MMAKLIRVPELHYLMIQFEINKFIRLTKASFVQVLVVIVL